MTADNGEQRLLNAVEALAASSEPIHRRLRTAGTLLLPLQASDFVEPADGELLEEILRALTGVSDPSGEHGDMVLSCVPGNRCPWRLNVSVMDACPINSCRTSTIRPPGDFL